MWFIIISMDFHSRRITLWFRGRFVLSLSSSLFAVLYLLQIIYAFVSINLADVVLCAFVLAVAIECYLVVVPLFSFFSLSFCTGSRCKHENKWKSLHKMVTFHFPFSDDFHLYVTRSCRVIYIMSFIRTANMCVFASECRIRNGFQLLLLLLFV